jgi:hypothetical protein
VRITLLVLIAGAGSACHLVLPHQPRDPSPDAAPVSDQRGERRLDGTPDRTRDQQRPACLPRVLALDTDADDGEIEGAAGWLPAGETPEQEPHGLYIGYWYTDPTWAYFRFALPAPLSEASSARLVLQGTYATPGWDEKNDGLLIGLEESADAAVVSKASEAPDRSQGRKLVGTLRWPESRGLEWRSSGRHVSVELAPLLNQLAKQRGGLAKGAHLQLWLRGDRSAGAAEVHSPARELDAKAAARLELCY